MGCLSSAERAAIEAEIVKLNAFILAAESAYTDSLTNSEISAYRFDSSDASQRADRRAPKQIREEIEALQASKGRLVRKLAGTLNVTMTFRRRGACY